MFASLWLCGIYQMMDCLLLHENVINLLVVYLCSCGFIVAASS